MGVGGGAGGRSSGGLTSTGDLICENKREHCWMNEARYRCNTNLI